jgi:glycine/D-amino acid oxidase-like deaminating enzyme/nitrite reductase/ring-hydroxylating ferredoxin subunit
MIAGLGKHLSPWLENEQRRRPRLEEAELAEVAVVGGGIVGLTTALQLAEAGREVVLVDQGAIGSGTTGHSTAKVTSQHGIAYAPLRGRHGADAARLYGQANEGAKEEIADRAASIDCAFRRRDAWVYATGAADRGLVEAEARAAQEAGLPARLSDEVPLPFPTEVGLAFGDQAEFDPLRYLAGLADRLEAAGGRIYEDSRAVGLSDGTPVEVELERGSVTAEHAVIATLIPFLDRGLFFARAFPSRSYCLTAALAGPPPDAMLISATQPTRSIRALPHGDRELLMIGGESHSTGSGDAVPERYRRLAEFADEHWEVAGFEHHWSSQDFSAADGIPYAGRLHPFTGHVWLATGMKKWGITNGTAAARVISDGILGRPNEAGSLLSSTRASLRAAPKLVEENAKVSLHLFGDPIRHRADRPIDDLARGEGAIVSARGDKVAGYRDEDGELHAVSSRCTHLHCQVAWNGAERTWDCPCHGSRFSVDGDVLNGPAVEPLPKRPTD